MTKPTGRPPGRPKGSKTKRRQKSERIATRVAAVIAREVPGAFQGDSHALLMSVYKDPSYPIEVRIEAAGKAIRFEKPLLAAVDVTSLGESIRYDVTDKPLTDDEWIEKHSTTH